LQRPRGVGGRRGPHVTPPAAPATRSPRAPLAGAGEGAIAGQSSAASIGDCTGRSHATRDSAAQASFGVNHGIRSREQCGQWRRRRAVLRKRKPASVGAHRAKRRCARSCLRRVCTVGPFRTTFFRCGAALQPFARNSAGVLCDMPLRLASAAGRVFASSSRTGRGPLRSRDCTGAAPSWAEYGHLPC
jgi:hypothetical protein